MSRSGPYSDRHAGQRFRLAARLAVRAAVRSLASGDDGARLLVIALIIAVAAVTAVTRLTDRVDAAIIDQSAQTLGADRVLEQDHPPSPAQQRALADPALTIASRTRLSTALAVGDQLLRVSLSAVSPNYPLAGQITLRRDGHRQTVRHGPPAGRVWIAPAVAARLSIGPGDTLSIGQARFVVAARLIEAPGGGVGRLDTAPSVMIRAADLAATGLTGPGARVHEDRLIDGPPKALVRLSDRLAPTLVGGARLVSPRQANRGLAAAMDKAEVFLDLAALAAVVLAGIAIALSATRHAESQRDAIALYKTLGGPRGVLRLLLAGQLALLGLAALVVGWLLGEAVAMGLVAMVARLFSVALPAGHWWASWPAAGTALVLLAVFAWPIQRHALATPPARVLSRTRDTHRRRSWPAHVLALLSVAVMAVFATGDLRLTAWVMAGLLAGAAVFAGLTHALLWLLARLRSSLDARLSPALRLGLDGVLRRRATVGLQCVALSMGVGVLLILVVVRGDLLAGWQASIAHDAPNIFLVDVMAGQRAGIARRLQAAGVDAPTFYPIVRARLTSVNGQALAAHPERRRAAGRLAKRAINLSRAATLKADNRIVAGHWWSKTDTAGAHDVTPVSIADSVARRLSVGIDDRLGFDVAGQSLTLRVASIRHIDWSSLQPNFFMLLPPDSLSDLPTRWITSIYLAPTQTPALADLVRAYPDINVIDIAALLDRVKSLIQRVSLAVELVFGFTLAAGMVVLAAAMGVHRRQRRREAAVLRALGATSGQLRRAAWVECLIIALLAGLPAAGAARVAAGLLASEVLHVPYGARPVIWLGALAVAVGLIATVGVLSLGDVRRQPAWRALRAGD